MANKKKTEKYSKEMLMGFYRTMCRIRSFEEHAAECFTKGMLAGNIHLSIGQEAAEAGAFATIQPQDYFTSTHRGHGHAIARGADPKLAMAELFGKKTGYCKGKGGSMHICDMDLGILGSNGIVGAGLPIAVGAGFACQYYGKGQVCACFFGDGASNRGTFHESLNMASEMKLPVIYVLENNFYAISGSQRELTTLENLSDRAKAYAIPGVTVDGNDVMAVIDAADEAVTRARKGEGPTLLECKTWRRFGHWEGDPDIRLFTYRNKEEHEAWLKRDPLPKFRNDIIQGGYATAEELNDIEKGVDKEIEEAIEFAENSPYPDVSILTEDVYA